MRENIELAINELTKFDGSIVSEEEFDKLAELANVFYVNNGTSGMHHNHTWYSFYVVEDDVDYEQCEKNHIEEFDIYF